MFTQFNQKTQVVFLDFNVDILEIPNDYFIDIVLSPTLYWVRKFSLPTKNPKEAKKLLPSLFDEFLPKGEYSYYGYFEGDDYIGFAYDESKINQLISQKGISFSKIKSIRFSQSEFDDESLPYKVDEKNSLVKKDSIVILLPNEFIGETKNIDLQNLKLSKHTVKIEQFSDIIDSKSVYLISFILVLFISIYGFSWYKTSKEISQLENKKENIFKKYDLLPTSLQNKASLKKYKKIAKKQKKLKEILSSLFFIRFSKGEYVEKVEYKKEVVFLKFRVKSKNNVMKKLQKFNPQNIEFKNDILTMEIKI